MPQIVWKGLQTLRVVSCNDLYQALISNALNGKYLLLLKINAGSKAL